MRKRFYDRYADFIVFISRHMGLSSKIRFETDEIKGETWGLILLNHCSIVDNLVLAHIKGVKWNDLRTISRISSKKLQNYILSLFDSLLINKDILHDMKQLKKILPLWRRAGKPLNLVLYPEGGIYMGHGLSEKERGYLDRLDLPPYEHLVFPSNGMCAAITSALKIDYIYDISLVYLLKGKRLIGEKEILLNLASRDLQIHVKMKRIPWRSENDLLYKLWSEKDQWINKKINI
jgi:hypothetical protein